MDWSDNAELQAIFREEVELRGGRLVEGARELTEEPLGSDRLSEMVRDAHTIKGNALVMGFPAIAEAAKLMEAAWKDLRDAKTTPTPTLATHLGQVAGLLKPAIDLDPDGKAVELQSATGALARVSGLKSDGPQSATPQSMSAASPLISQGAGTETSGEVEPPVPNERTASPEDAGESPHNPLDLGGLLSSLESGIIGEVTRVETARLYELINRSVEVRLDMSALATELTALSDAADARSADVVALAAESEKSANALETALLELQRSALGLATVPLREVTDTFPQLARYLCRRTGKEARFELVGDDVEVDRQIIDALREPLRHLLVNAIDHGIETPGERVSLGKPPTATVAVRATVKDHRLIITVEDDGRGVDWETVLDVAHTRKLIPEAVEPRQPDLARLLFAPGFSTVSERTDLSGDGSGLSSASDMAEELNGGLRLDTTNGGGTTVVLTLPASLALQDVLLVRTGGYRWGLPQVAVLAHFPVASAEIRAGAQRMELWYQGRALPLSSFAAAVGVPELEQVSDIVVLATRLGPIAVTVPQIEGRRQVAVKGLGPVLAGAPHVAGAALLGGGDVVVVVEPNRLGDRVRVVPSPIGRRPRVLLVDDSHGARQLVSATLTSQGFEVLVAANAEEGVAELKRREVDGLVVDYQMPGSDGVEFVNRVRAAGQTIPVVMVSGVADAEDQNRAWKAGVDAYLDKFDLRKGALVSTLRSLLEMRGFTFGEREE